MVDEQHGVAAPDTPQLGASDDETTVTWSDLPTRNERNLAIRLTPAGTRALRADHPWIFADSIAEQSHDGAPGDLAVVFDRRRDFAAVGLYDPTSPIRVRVLQRRRRVTVDRSFWTRRIHEALERRVGLLTDPGTTGLRIVNGEGDRLSGLVVDRYARVVVVKLYSEAWLPHLEDIVGALLDALEPTAVVLRLSRALVRRDVNGLSDGAVLAGTLADDAVEFLEAGLSFVADVRRGPKTGHFCDQRDNRRAVRDLGADTVLDVFCSTGGFTLSAAAGGASRVDAVDQSRPALAALEANVARNRGRGGVGDCEVRTHVGDAFEQMTARRRAGERYDLVIVDPPSFAHRAADAGRAVDRYAELAELGASLTRPGGTLLQASCSSRVDGQMLERAVRRGISRTQRPATIVRRSGHAIDHPVRHPEGEYLHALTFTVG